MSLPLCVKVKDDKSAACLRKDGWRFIGKLVEYRGFISRAEGKGCREVTAKEIVDLVGKIEWKGRLWRDNAIDRKDALAETIRFIRAFDGNIYTIGTGAGFCLSKNNRVVLVGVLPEYQGLGLGRKLVSTAAQRGSGVVAATYSDNVSAVCLYESLEMESKDACVVYHK